MADARDRRVWVHDQVKIASDGAVWISAGYRIYRFDPTSEAFATLDFDVRVPGALNDGSDGTWVSAIAPDGEDLMVARHNLPWLTRVAPTMEADGQIPLPAEWAGAYDLGVISDRVFALGAGGGIAVFTPEGTQVELHEIEAQRLEVIRGMPFMHAGFGASGEIAWLDPDSLELVRVPGGEGVFATAGAGEDGHVIAYDTRVSDTNPARLIVLDGEHAETLTEFPRQRVELTHCPHPGASGGGCPFALAGAPAIVDIVVDAGGDVWYLQGGGMAGAVWLIDRP